MVDATQQAQGADNKGTHSCPMLVLGVGNILLRDEGIGVRVVEAMQKLDLPPEVELFDGATAGMDLLNVLADRRKVIVIDAIEGDYEPGTVLRLRPEDLAAPSSASVSLHEAGLLDVLSVAQLLNLAPQEVVVLGVKPKTLDCGLELSAELAERVPRIVELVLAELRC